MLVELYAGPLASVLILVMGGGINTEMLLYMMEITLWWILGLAFIYPMIFAFLGISGRVARACVLSIPSSPYVLQPFTSLRSKK